MTTGGGADRRAWPIQFQELYRELERERSAHARTRRELERSRSHEDDLAADIARRRSERRAMAEWIIELRRALTTVVGVGETLAAHREHLPPDTVATLFDQLNARSRQVTQLLRLLDGLAEHPGRDGGDG